MQSKKRAKPVKFGKESRQKVQKEKVELEKDEKAEENAEPQESDAKESDEIRAGKGIEAHFSSTVETIDIKEIPGTEDEEVTATEEKEPEQPAAPASEEESSESEKEETTVSDSGEEEKSTSTPDTESSEEAEEEQDTTDESIVNKDGAFFNVPPDAYDKKRSMTGYFFKIMLLTFVLGFIFFGGIYYATSGNRNLFSFGDKSEPVVTKAPEEATPTEESVDLSAYDIRVLNGTATPGLAAKLRDELEAAGFTVVSVGNADKDDFTTTQIEVAKKVEKAYVDKLKDVLSKSYEVGDTKTLSSPSADVVVTIGSASAN